MYYMCICKTLKKPSENKVIIIDFIIDNEQRPQDN